MNLQFKLPDQEFLAVQQALGENITYCVPADLSFDGRRTNGYFVIGETKWVHVVHGEVIETCSIHEAHDYKVVPLIGNVMIEATHMHTPRIIIRCTMQHAARLSYIAQILNYMASNSKFRIYNNESEPVCSQCGGHLVQGTRLCPKCMNKGAAFKKLWDVSKSHWKILITALVVLLIMSAVTLTGPYFQKILVNSALQPPDGVNPSTRIFLFAIAGIAFGLVAGELLGVLRGRIMARVSSRIAADLRMLVFEKVQSLSLGFLTSQRAGDIMNRINSDTDRIRNLIQEVFSMAIYQVIMLASVSFLLFYTDWKLALIIILPAPIVVYIQYFVWKAVLRKLFRKQWRVHDKANSFLHDVLSGIRVVKAFGKEEREIKRFRAYHREYALATIQSEKVYSYLSPISHYLIHIGQYFVLLAGCHMILGGELSLGELVQFTGYAAMIYGPLGWLMNMPRWIANALISVERVFSVIDEQPEIIDKQKSLKHRIDGTISFKNVTFGYKSYEPVLKSIDVDIKKGEMIGLVGHSGSGKSTFINLISRFYDVNEGTISIDGVDIRDIKQEDLRSQIGVVLQETFLFSGTIMNNIKYSKPEATMEEVIQAAKIANAHHFISQFPDGYDTKLEENGNNISGGERQRLAIARAVLNNPRILILDEATASLDIETESEIQEALQRVTKNRTTIAIAHRLATLKNADRLLVLNKGVIAEIGTHEELIQKRGIYYKLLSAQRNMSKTQTERVLEPTLHT
ncbi:ABC transporter ATP-binding protein [Paenibacillus lautus]|uniref:ABC transporter ATP-binding protein n=1 Tax=Paenibacillus lautus TaxID=1401 RepID=UPI001C108B2E|nr:ABC transporter ATP-binding protein [Paenibacillus lautus]MBU5347927.1 ABC transporter ATP-binding protein/permease [Paenibacillus lautus]